jgi:hypothetical protein
VAGGHPDTQNGRGERVRLKQLSVFRYLRQPRSATTLKKWRGEESPSVLRRRGCQQSLKRHGKLEMIAANRRVIMLNPSIRQEPRYEPAAVIPLKKDASIVEWLEKNNRMIPRDKVAEPDLTLEEDVELSELMDVDDISYDEDEDELVLDED